MIQPETILRDTAVCLLPLVVVGGLLDGWLGAAGVVVTGLLVLGNLWVLGKVITRLTHAMATEDGSAGMAWVVLALKFPLLLAAAIPLVWLFGAIPVGVAFSALVFAVFVRGVVMLFHTPGADPTDAPQGS